MVSPVPDSLIFDLDGTLWDAVQTYSDAWNLFFRQHNLPLETSKSKLNDLMGLEEGLFLEIMLPSFSPEMRSQFYREIVQIQYELIDRQGGVIYEGVPEGLERLAKRYALFIVSNCPRHTIRHFMKFAGLESLITDSISHGQNYQSKHVNIRELILNYDLEKPLYIGDTDGDREQSEKAGVPFVFMEYGFGNATKCMKSFRSFSDFTEYYLNL